MNESIIKELFEMREFCTRQELRKQQRQSKANHRHNWKQGKITKTFGSKHLVQCAVKDCNEVKIYHVKHARHRYPKCGKEF